MKEQPLLPQGLPYKRRSPAAAAAAAAAAGEGLVETLQQERSKRRLSLL